MVVDASVVFKWLVHEVDAAWAATLLNGQRRLVAPDLVLTECCNALWRLTRRGELAANRHDLLLADLATSPLVLVRADLRLHGAALRLATALQHPVYDCLYLALALERGACLATADARFARLLLREQPIPRDRLLIPAP